MRQPLNRLVEVLTGGLFPGVSTDFVHTAAGATEIIAGQPGRALVITRLDLSGFNTAVTAKSVTFRDGAAGAERFRTDLPPTVALTTAFPVRTTVDLSSRPWKLTVGNGLQLVASAGFAGSFSCSVDGYLSP